jgi:hypothetical protein
LTAACHSLRAWSWQSLLLRVDELSGFFELDAGTKDHSASSSVTKVHMQVAVDGFSMESSSRYSQLMVQADERLIRDLDVRGCVHTSIATNHFIGRQPFSFNRFDGLSQTQFDALHDSVNSLKKVRPVSSSPSVATPVCESQASGPELTESQPAG